MINNGLEAEVEMGAGLLDQYENSGMKDDLTEQKSESSWKIWDHEIVTEFFKASVILGDLKYRQWVLMAILIASLIGSVLITMEMEDIKQVSVVKERFDWHKYEGMGDYPSTFDVLDMIQSSFGYNWNIRFRASGKNYTIRRDTEFLEVRENDITKEFMSMSTLLMPIANLGIVWFRNNCFTWDLRLHIHRHRIYLEYGPSINLCQVDGKYYTSGYANVMEVARGTFEFTVVAESVEASVDYRLIVNRNSRDLDFGVELIGEDCPLRCTAKPRHEVSFYSYWKPKKINGMLNGQSTYLQIDDANIFMLILAALGYFSVCSFTLAVMVTLVMRLKRGES